MTHFNTPKCVKIAEKINKVAGKVIKTVLPIEGSVGNRSATAATDERGHKKMIVKAYLEGIRLLGLRINSNLEELYRVKQLLGTIPGGRTDGRITGKGQVSSPTENLAVKLTELDADIVRMIDELVDLKAEALHMLHQLESYEQEYVLTAYYIHGKSVSQIAADIGKTTRQAFRIKRTGLDELQKNQDSGQTILY